MLIGPLIANPIMLIGPLIGVICIFDRVVMQFIPTKLQMGFRLVEPTTEHNSRQANII